MKLSRRGHVMPEALQANAHLVHHVSDITLAKARVVSGNSGIDSLDLREDPQVPSQYVVEDDHGIYGVISRDWARSHPDELARARSLAELASPNYVQVASDCSLFDLLARMQKAQGDCAVVVQSKRDRPTGTTPQVLGVVTKAHLAEALAEGMELFGD